MTIYRCTKHNKHFPRCDWNGDSPVHLHLHAPRRCPVCGSQVEDLDFLERAAIREEAPMDREDAERLAREDLEKWREDLI